MDFYGYHSPAANGALRCPRNRITTPLSIFRIMGLESPA